MLGRPITSRGTGVQLETWPLDLELGLEEGVELHTVPVNPGRIGFNADLHRDPPQDAAPGPRERDGQSEHARAFIGLFSGVGSNGVTAHVPARLELPNELRVEVDASSYVRVGALASIGWYPGSSSRSGGSLVSPFADELLLSAFVRLGRAEACGCGAAQGRGYFLALSRGELMGSAWFGANFWIEADFGY